MDCNYVHNVNATPEMYNRCRQNGDNYVSVGHDYGRPISSGIKVIKNNYQKEHIEEAKPNNSISFISIHCSNIRILL